MRGARQLRRRVFSLFGSNKCLKAARHGALVDKRYSPEPVQAGCVLERSSQTADNVLFGRSIRVWRREQANEQYHRS